MLRCRENDIAIVLKGPYIGFTVTVGKFEGDKTLPNHKGENVDGINLWLIHNRDIEQGLRARTVLMEDRHLQPIRGRGTDQTTTTKKEMRA